MSLPEGFSRRDTHIVAARRRLVDKIRETIEPIGYREGYTPTVYPVKDSFPRQDLDDRTKLIDKDGSVLCLAEDATTALLQTAPSYGRVYGSTEGCKLFGVGGRNEYSFSMLFTGVAGPEAEAELIIAGIKIAERLNIPVGKIVLGNTRVLQGVAESCKNRRVSKSELGRYIDGTIYAEEDYTAVKLIREIAGSKGGISIIGQAAEKISNKQSVDALISLFELSKILEECGFGEKVEFDLSALGNHYDCGNVFSIYDDSNNRLIDGGRHDFDDGTGIVRAVSARIYPDYILSVHPEVDDKKTDFDAVIGVADGINAVKAAYRLNNGFVGEGLRVTTVYKTDADSLARYAADKEIKNVIFVDADGNVHYE